MRLNWINALSSTSDGSFIQSKNYTCGYCGEPLVSNVGFSAYEASARGENVQLSTAKIYICHFCSKPTFFDDSGRQTPGSAFGGDVKEIPSQVVRDLYDEARNCMKVSAYTAAVLCCRKLLMNIAVDQDADQNKPFAYYVDYLADQGYLPPNGKKWAGHIKDKGNEATHEIPVMGADDARELIEFSEMMLKFIYEYPARIEDRAQKAEAQGG